MKRILIALLAVSCQSGIDPKFEPLPERSDPDDMRSDPDDMRSDGDDMLEMSAMPKEDFVFTFILTGPYSSELTPEETSTAMAGHFSNMRKLGEEGVLLFAGPLGEPLSQPDHRGIFVFDTPTAADGEALALTDPAVQAGVFHTKCYPFRSATELRRVPKMIVAKREAQGEDDQTRNVRAYVMVTTEALDEAALDRISLLDVVVMSGMFGGEMEGTALMVVAAETIDEARSLLEARSVKTEAFTFHPLWGSDTLVEL